MEWDVSPSHPVPTLGIEDVSRYPDRDVGMLAGRSVPTHGMVPHPGAPRDVPLGPVLSIARIAFLLPYP